MTGERVEPVEECACGGTKHGVHDVCTRCAWRLGWDEARVVTGTDERYGPYAGAIRERVASCTDYLGRITRQLAGVPDRQYVAGKAHELREAAARLVDLCHDVEGWLRSCGEEILREDDGDTWLEECALVHGHGGSHTAHPPNTKLQLARYLAGNVAEASVGFSDHLGWIVHSPDRLRDRFDLEDLGSQYDSLRRGVDRLSPALSALRTATGYPEIPGWFPEEVSDAGPGWGADDEDELVCSECGFEAESIEQLAEHQREGCR